MGVSKNSRPPKFATQKFVDAQNKRNTKRTGVTNKRQPKRK